MSLETILEIVIAEVIAFAAFFAYPAFQYISLRRFARREGLPELWYLPDYGFRLVARNIPGKRVLSDARYAVCLRRIIPPSSGSSVATFYDDFLFESEEMLFVFPRTDLTLVGFRLEGTSTADLQLVVVDKVGQEVRRTPLSDFDRIVCDYTATVENPLNFDVKIAKRVEMKSTSLCSAWESLRDNNTERSFPIDRIRDVS